MGTKDLDGLAHRRLLQKMPLKQTQCRRLLGLITTASSGSVPEAQVAGDEGRLLDVFSTGNDCDTGRIPDVCDVERIASGKVVSTQQLR